MLICGNVVVCDKNLHTRASILSALETFVRRRSTVFSLHMYIDTPSGRKFVRRRKIFSTRVHLLSQRSKLLYVDVQKIFSRRAPTLSTVETFVRRLQKIFSMYIDTLMVGIFVRRRAKIILYMYIDTLMVGILYVDVQKLFSLRTFMTSLSIPKVGSR